MSVRRKLLWIDSGAGAVAGITVLLLAGWLSKWYQVSQDLVILNGVVNLAYASYSLSLAVRSKRPRPLIRLLVVANLAWAVVCSCAAVILAKTASVFGIAHLIGEALFVGGLARLEWRWQDLLQTA